MRPAGLTRAANDDLDLHIVTPSRKEICYSHPKSRCGGELDVDANRDEATAIVDPVENMFWPTGKAPIGHFAIKEGPSEERLIRCNELRFWQESCAMRFRYGPYAGRLLEDAVVDLIQRKLDPERTIG